MANRITLAEVAEAAGVGIATVSRAMSDHPHINAETRDHVRRVARELGYRPSAAARALRTGGYRALSVIIPDNAWGWWEPAVQAAVHAAAREGFQISAFPVGGDPGGVASVIERLANAPIEGALILGDTNDAEIRAACDKLGLAAVAIDDAADNLLFPTVSSDGFGGGLAVTRHLIDQGAERIAILGGSYDWRFAAERLQGYERALRDAGIEPDPELSIPWTAALDESEPRSIDVEDFLARGTRFDAIFCVADFMAAPALRTLSSHGLRVPADVLLAGFDGERAAVLLNPQLTTLRQPFEEMAAQAVALLARQLAGETVPNRRVQVEGTLIVRGSSIRVAAPG